MLDLRCLRPLDVEGILASVRRTHRAVVVDEGWLTGSFAAEISARIMEGAFDELDAPVARVCSVEVPIPYPAHLEEAALPSAGARPRRRARSGGGPVTATFVMPMLGADMAAGALAQWYRAPGDAVRRGDIVAAVETDKGVIDVECFATGVMGEQLVAEGQEVPVGTPLATILGEGGGAAAAQAGSAPRAGARRSRAAGAGRSRSAVAAAGRCRPSASAVPVLHRHASPLALRFAREHGVDIVADRGHRPARAHAAARRRRGRSGTRARRPRRRTAAARRERVSSPRSSASTSRRVTGSGPGGRVMRKDVEAARPAAGRRGSARCACDVRSPPR